MAPRHPDAPPGDPAPGLTRRAALLALGALPLAAAACARDGQETAMTPAPAAPPAPGSRMPVLFAAHGAPTLLDDAAWVGELAAWAAALPRPEAILMVSAHWDRRPATHGATRTVPLLHDFYGFPERYYAVEYPAPGAPALAARVRGLLETRGHGVAEDPARGLDHGAYVPLVAMYPDARVPVLQVSLPGLDAPALLAFGKALAPLRDEGVLVFGSGFLTHNMRYAFKTGTPAWASGFDAWAAEALARFDVDALVDFQAKAPGAAMALPTWEHYAPVLVAAGAAAGGSPRTTFPVTGWWNDGAFTKRSVQFDG